jgi:isopentenyl diphosphate isomerase/L-lactate dehydrogenase-like FMN-dependent dehydrogenase
MNKIMPNDYPIINKLDNIPQDVVALSDYHRLAKEFMPFEVYEYIHSGVADEKSLKNNRDAFDKIQLYNRVLADVSQGSTHTELLGKTFRHPILLAPVAHQKLVHHEGELATIEAANAMQTGMVTSTLASTPLEHIAAQSNQEKWFQLYFQAERQQTLDVVKRAEAAGYSAIIVTADVPINGLRNRIQRSGFQLPTSAQAANISSPSARKSIELNDNQSVVFQGIMNSAPTWQDLQWLRNQTQLPILLKGVSHPDDASKAMQLGLNGIVVSNHGGRSLDGIAASIELLPTIRERIGMEATILLDSGIRRGTDVFKALALGANAVMIGRPQIDALAVAGALGVAHMLKLLRDELEVTMALAGTPKISDINASAIYYQSIR